MPELRWILLLAGVVAIVGIYLWSRRRGAARPERDLGRREPVMDRPSEPWESAGPASRTTPAPGEEDEPPVAGEQLIVVLRVRSRGSEGFPGAVLAEAFEQDGLMHGRLGAFHSMEPRGRSRFMVASLTEPGSFDPDTLPEQIIEGVSLFMVLPGPSDPPATLDAMLSFARRLAGRLGGEVLDENGDALTAQEAAYLREKVVEYWRRVHIGGGLP